jgi:putative ABC transport system permease protein
VLERRREIGVLKAVGWRTATVARLFVAEGTLLGLLGGLAGAALGLALFVGLYQSVSSRLVWIAAVGVLAPLLVGALAALYPARVAARIPPAEAVRYE